jgi:hypothetical protein
MALSSAKAVIFRITHIDNVEWDLEHGLQCRNSRDVNPSFREIGNVDLIAKRKNRVVPIPPGGTLSDYIPFYFTSRSPMLYNIKTGYNGIPKVPMEEIVIYAASLRQIAADGFGFVYTDRHAKLELAEFSSDLNDLNRIDWPILERSDFKHDPLDPGKMERYQAEALIHHELPCGSLGAIVCRNAAAQDHVDRLAVEHGIAIQTHVKPGMYF